MHVWGHEHPEAAADRVERKRIDGRVEVNSDNGWYKGELEQLMPYKLVPVKQSL